MQILSGIYKGLKITTTRNIPYRPTQTRIRKSLFDMLGDISGNTVLDLFSGTGILGFEAASRGADSVTFVENNYSAVKMLNKNISLFNYADFNLQKEDAFKYVESCGQFDLIFADPPYGKYSLNRLSKFCLAKLNKSGKFVLEVSSNDNTVHAHREKRYGDTKLLIWRNE